VICSGYETISAVSRSIRERESGEGQGGGGGGRRLGGGGEKGISTAEITKALREGEKTSRTLDLRYNERIIRIARVGVEDKSEGGGNGSDIERRQQRQKAESAAVASEGGGGGGGAVRKRSRRHSAFEDDTVRL
jgi:hypothetical protein